MSSPQFRSLVASARAAAQPPEARPWDPAFVWGPWLAGLLLCYCVPFAIDGIVAQVTDPWDCSDVIPKLRPAIGRFGPDAFCRANSQLWAAFYSVLAIYAAAMLATLALNRRRLTLDRVRAMPDGQGWYFLAFAWLVAIACFSIYLLTTVQGPRRSVGVEHWRSVEVYADHQINALCFVLATLIGFLLFTATAIMIAPDRES